MEKKIKKLIDIASDNGFKYGLMVLFDQEMNGAWSAGYINRKALENSGLSIEEFRKKFNNNLEKCYQSGLEQAKKMLDEAEEEQEAKKSGGASHKEKIRTELKNAIKKAGINLEGHTIDEVVEYGEKHGFFDEDGNILEEKIKSYKKYLLKKLVASAISEDLESLLDDEEE